MGMDQYLLISFLGGWTSIYQLFWCSPGVQGFDTLPYMGHSIDSGSFLLWGSDRGNLWAWIGRHWHHRPAWIAGLRMRDFNKRVVAIWLPNKCVLCSHCHVVLNNKFTSVIVTPGILHISIKKFMRRCFISCDSIKRREKNNMWIYSFVTASTSGVLLRKLWPAWWHHGLRYIYCSSAADLYICLWLVERSNKSVCNVIAPPHPDPTAWKKHSCFFPGILMRPSAVRCSDKFRGMCTHY